MEYESIILMGIKHCGKSTQGQCLSRKFGLPFYDTDDLIREITGKSPRQIYTEGGAEAFMEAEKNACVSLVEKVKASGKDAVIATGGGICNNKAALDVLHPLGVFVFLKAEEKLAADRILEEVTVAKDGTIKNLPAYIAKKNPHTLEDVRTCFHQFYEERSAIYAGIADVTVVMTDESVEKNTDHIICAL